MQQRQNRTLGFFTLGALILGCASADSGSLFISEEQEIALGGEVHQGIIQDYPIYYDPTVTAYVSSVGQEIVAVSRRPNLQHRFYVLDTDVINAFAGPGGYVYVTTGLMREMASRAELAGVLGHEVGHVSGRHGVKAMETQLTLGLLLEAVFGSESATGQVIAWGTEFYWSTAHSRDQELEADMLGVEFAHAANYNPWGLVDFFEFLKAVSGPSNSVSDFLSSHPNADDRIEQSTTQIGALGVTRDEPGLVVDDTSGGYVSYDEIKAMLPAPGSSESPGEG